MAIRPCFCALRRPASRAECVDASPFRQLLDEGASATLSKGNFCGNMRRV
jgi:hypothetical protein